MDEFDKSIKSANKTIEPSANFVDLTMDKVAKLPKARSGWGFKAWGSVLGGLAALLAVVFIVVPMAGNSSTKTESLNNVSSSKGLSSSPTQSAGSSTGSSSSLGGSNSGGSSSSPTTMPAGTSNASLSSDLNSISSSINQENNDQSAANSAINDSSQEIAVPTN